MHFADLFQRRLEQGSELPALADEHNGTLSNAETAARIDLARACLSAAGVSAGDVVAVKLPNRVELIITLFAAWQLGAAVTPVNPSLTRAEVEYQLADCAPRVLVTNDTEEFGVARLSVNDLTAADLTAADATPPAPATAGRGDDLALLVYTSGTTGRPKGVMLTHDNVMAMASSISAAMGSGPDTHSLLILPLFHVNGIVVSVLSPLLSGGRTTVAGRFDPRTFFGLIEKYRPTYFSAVPTIYTMLTALPADVEPDTSSLQFAICGAAPMPPTVMSAFENRYGVPIVEGYGLSEATCASTTNPRNGIRKAGTVGTALPGQRVGILAPDGSLVTDGSPGEVVIQGPTVMRGYLNQPEETAKTIVDGWLRTGDVGVLDADGYLTLVDRAKDMIIRGGENIYPKEIETVLYQHPGVHEAAVVGRPDPVYGQVPVAFVVLKPDSGATAHDMASHIEAALAKYKRPEILLVETVPKNAVGKIDKPALRRQLGTATPSHA
ncbi:AMP-dependent synthetase [Mycolicibacterium sp. CH28]|uniref:class I adenylate-forming enzyme family protein n=1 Tax=Mycolicibacterium sp. CH28 TaxID=2512237 RepID=UPI001080CD67|nr:AMP-binding protein [Mycolicibacterium sp. CH28]TGD84588.1 AMP-dependent synthetase [Mycolicibacterium sp. CH28]